MSTANEQLIERIYAAFDARDGDAMAACYAPGARFSDPVFPDLNGAEPGAMWRMLTAQATELRIELLEHEADDDEFSFHRWSRQALGTPGLLLGWTPVLKASVRLRAGAGLEKFMTQNG
jgi:hypothetical protein